MFKQIVMAAALAVGLAGCAQPYKQSAQEQQAQEAYNSYVGTTNAQVKAGLLSKREGAQRIANFVAENHPQDYAAQDAWNYSVKVYTDLEQGKISEQDATYMIQKKRLDHERDYQARVDQYNAGIDQKNNAALGVFLLGAGSAVQNSVPRPVGPTNCISTTSGNTVNTNCN